MTTRATNIEILKKGGVKNAEVFYEILINDFCKGELDTELNKFWTKKELDEQLKKGFKSTEDMAVVINPLIVDFVKHVKNAKFPNNVVFELTGRFEILSKIMIDGADDDFTIKKDTIDETPIRDIQLLFETREICDEVACQIKNLNSKKPSKKVTYVYLEFDKKYIVNFENIYKAKREKIQDIEIGVELKSSQKLYMLRIILCGYFQGYNLNDPLMKKMCELNLVDLKGESQCGVYKFIVEEMREKPLLTEDELVALFEPKKKTHNKKKKLKKEIIELKDEVDELKDEVDVLKDEVDVLKEENNELKKDAVEMQTDYVKVLQGDYPFFVTFSKTRFIKDSKEIINLFRELYESNEKFVNLIKKYNTICVIQGIHTDFNRFEKSQHITGYLFNTITHEKSGNLHFYLTNESISSITEVTNLI
jgi:FtsZ-binding cell division protein ZapB